MGGSHVASGIFGLSVVGLAWIEARTFPIQGLQEGLGAAFFPWLVLGIISLLSLGSLTYGLVRGVRFDLPFARSPELQSAVGLFAALCAFSLAFVFFGFLIPLIAFLVVGMRILGASWRYALFVGGPAGIAVYGLFVVGFGVPMPS